MNTQINAQEIRLIGSSLELFEKQAKRWDTDRKTEKLWNKDASLWTGGEESKWLGWLDIVAQQKEHVSEFTRFQEQIKNAQLRHAVVLGMGGSSLCPEVFGATIPPHLGFPDLHILDSTAPEQIKNLEDSLDLRKTLFIVSSKSGTTLEPNLLCHYFLDKMKRTFPDEIATRRFIAITDPGSELEKFAVMNKFWRIFYGIPSVGGRYSALTQFGLVPAAILGIDIELFLNRAESMVEACQATGSATENPGISLGILLGISGLQNKNKITFLASPEIWDLGNWLEQLIAESTGKQKKGLIPITGERLAYPAHYGGDRVFIYLKLKDTHDIDLDLKLQALSDQGAPVVTIQVDGALSLGQEFFRWELATAVAGSILNINPFDQPDVEESKQETRKITSRFESEGNFTKDVPLFEEQGIAVYGEPSLGTFNSIHSCLKAFFEQIQPEDYFAVLAYLKMNFSVDEALQEIRHAVRDVKKVATCIEFGPRFLHSTGQIYKGGPLQGVFLQLTTDNQFDVMIPGHRYTFGLVQAAQAHGDIKILKSRGQRCLRMHFRKSQMPKHLTEGNYLINGLRFLKNSVLSSLDLLPENQTEYKDLRNV